MPENKEISTFLSASYNQSALPHNAIEAIARIFSVISVANRDFIAIVVVKIWNIQFIINNIDFSGLWYWINLFWIQWQIVCTFMN